MKISHHAVIRFLQRVLNKSKLTNEDIKLGYKFLETETKDIVVNGYKAFFRLPSFKNYRAVVQENTIVTIVPKGWNYDFNRVK